MQKCPMFLPKNIVFVQKSPVFLQKSSVFLQKSCVFLQKSPVSPQTSHHQHSLYSLPRQIHILKSQSTVTCIIQNLCNKALHFCKRLVYFTGELTFQNVTASCVLAAQRPCSVASQQVTNKHMYIYISICMNVCVHLYIYIWIFECTHVHQDECDAVV